MKHLLTKVVMWLTALLTLVFGCAVMLSWGLICWVVYNLLSVLSPIEQAVGYCCAIISAWAIWRMIFLESDKAR